MKFHAYIFGYPPEINIKYDYYYWNKKITQILY